MAILATLVGGCLPVSVSYVPLNPAPHPRGAARDPADVPVFSSSPPDRPHVDVGLILVDGGDFDDDPRHLIGRLRETAASLGCDAIVLGPPSLSRHHLPSYAGTCVFFSMPLASKPQRDQ